MLLYRTMHRIADCAVDVVRQRNASRAGLQMDCSGRRSGS